MPITRLHTNSGVKVDPDSFSGTPVILGGITRVGLRINNQVVNMPTSGEAYARFQALYGQDIRPTFTTLNPAAALAICALSGLKIAAAVAGSGLTMWAQSIAEGGIRTSGPNHDTWNFKEGLLYPTTMNCEHQGDLALDYDLATTWDGTNDPVVIATGASLPTVTDAERFTLGGVTLGGISFTQKSGVSVDLGLRCNVDGSDSDTWATFAWIEDVNPKVTIRGVDKKWFDATKVALTGLVMTHANTKVYFRKRAAGGTFVADGTAEHIKLTMAGLVVVDVGWEATGSSKGNVTLALHGKYDGTNLPIVINPAAAIT